MFLNIGNQTKRTIIFEKLESSEMSSGIAPRKKWGTQVEPGRCSGLRREESHTERGLWRFVRVPLESSAGY